MTEPQPNLKPMNARVLVACAAMLLCIGAVIWATRVPPPVPAPTPDPPALPIEIAPQKTAAELRAERDAFFTSDVDPCIAAADKLNREAAARCVKRLKESFDGYRTGIAPFCREINTWGTRLGVVKRMPTDWWYEETNVADFIQDKFARHLFTDKQLANDIDAALNQFRDDVQANQNQMLTQIRAAVSQADLPNLPAIDTGTFVADTSQRFRDFSATSAEASLVKGITIEVGSMAGGAVGEFLLAQLIAKLSTMAAASTVGAGGATAGGAAVGGGGGSFGGPVGTVAGIAVGLVIGGIIDWWMSSRFEAQMTDQLNEMIDELTDTAIAGTANKPGLRDGLRGSCDLMLRTYQASLRTSIVDRVDS